MAVTTTKTNKPINPRGNDQSPKGYNRAALYSGKALDFDGVNDLIAITDSASVSSEFQSIGNNDSYTLCAYFKTTDTATAAGWVASENTIIELRQEVTAGKVPFSFGVNGGKLTFGRNDTAGSTGNIYKNSGSTNVSTGDYFFGVAVIDNDNAKLYVNGALDLDDTITTSTGDCSVGTTTSNFFVGSRSTDAGGTSSLFDGQIAGFKIFNTALTAAQVSDLYNNPEKIVPTGVEDTDLKLFLPMMEGAGTTAYDGSGNGNHGTISGATYVHGVGSPVAQTAVIDWNKGQNLLKYSEELDRGSYWSTTAAIVTSNDTTAPDGQETADLLKETTTSAPHYINIGVITAASTTYVQSVWVKKKDDGIYAGIRTNGVGGDSYIIFDFDTATIVAAGSDIISNGVEAYSNGWYRIYMTYTLQPTGAIYSVTNSSSSVIPSYTGTGKGYYIWGAQLEASDSLTAYIPNHTETPITSPVLLPQGLTSGRDITGVNLFENVRKQGALNLDGNSWAEVHDNASLDIGDFSLEMWVNINEFTGTYQTFLAKEDSASDRSYELFLHILETKFGSNIHGTQVTFADTNPVVNTWYHLVSTFNDSTNTWTAYINGSQNTTASVSETQNDTDAPIIIGCWYDKSSFMTHGQIAQPRIYNRALTAEEVERNYNAGKNIYS